jgi:hypothetical protein
LEDRFAGGDKILMKTKRRPGATMSPTIDPHEDSVLTGICSTGGAEAVATGTYRAGRHS